MKHGDYVPFSEDHPSAFAFLRSLEDQRLAVVASFRAAPDVHEVPDDLRILGTRLFDTPETEVTLEREIELAPFEVVVVRGCQQTLSLRGQGG